MANQEHLAILKQGVQVWNDWRKKNPEIIPDLVGADLIGVNLIGEKIIQGQIAEFDPIEPIFKEQQIREFYFKSPISGIRTVQLSGANLSRANLREANLYGVNLFASDLEGASLSSADIRYADLRETNLLGANLLGANLSYARLCGATLSQTTLISVDFTGADLHSCILWSANAIFANFYKAILTGACIQDWNINRNTNLEEVICDYIYLMLPEQERRPHEVNKNFASGEFTKLFKKTLETVDLIFHEGVDWNAFAYSLKNTQVLNEDTPLTIQSIENKEDELILIRVKIPDDIDKNKIHRDFMQGYELAHKYLESQYQARTNDKDKEINQLFLLLNQTQEKLPELMAQAKKEFNINSSVVSVANEGIQSNMSGIVQGNQISIQHNYTSEQKQTLAQAAAEIQQLLNQLSQTNPTTTNKEKIAVVSKAVDQIENNLTLKARVINALKVGGIEALKEAINHPLVNILMATLEGWQEGQ